MLAPLRFAGSGFPMFPPKSTSAALAMALFLCARAAGAGALEAPYQLDALTFDLRDRGADPAADPTWQC